jgi:hypothetical protein
MLYQGDVNDIDPQLSNTRLMNNNNDNNKQDTMLVNAHDDAGLAARVKQELCVREQKEPSPRQNEPNGHLQPDQSSSRLTDMLHGVSPGRGDFNGRFQPNCPSAVPSPLHKMPGPVTPLQAMPLRLDSELFGPTLTPKTIHDHFYMTNEHLDVLGKSNWDQIEGLKKEMYEKSSNRHAQLITTVEKHVHEIKMQVDSVNEKADRTTEQGHNIHTKLEKLFDFVKDDVVGALAVQDKKMTDMEQNVRDVHKTLQNMQRMLEPKHVETNMDQPYAITAPVASLHGGTSPPSLPGHRSQPSLAGYYGSMTESGREGPPPMPHMQDHRSSNITQDTQSDPRAGYGSNYEQRWGPRGGYQGRSSKEERPYPGTNPYQFANSAIGGGQFSNGYSGGYPTYGQQGESHYAFHPGAAK